jgi:predicted dehydrogenase
MSDRLGTAIVGLDHWYFAYAIAEALLNTDRATLISVSDHDDAKAQKAACRFHAPRNYSNYDEAVGDPDVDVVVVTTTTAEHLENVVKALAAGKHVFCNKPMAMNVEEAQRMIDASRNAKGKLLVLQGTWRYWPMALKVKEYVAGGMIGDIISARFWTRAPLPQVCPGSAEPGWFVDRTKAAGGAFIDHAIYQADMMEWFTGNKIRKFGSHELLRLRYKDLPVEDYGYAVGIFANGVQAIFEEWWMGHVFSTGFELRGTKGEIIADSAARPNISIYNAERGERLYVDPAERGAVLNAMEVYFDYLTGKTSEVPSTGEDGQRILAAITGLNPPKN